MAQHHAVSPLTAATSVKTAYRRGMNASSLDSHGFLTGGISVVRNLISMKVHAGDTPDVTAMWNIDYRYEDSFDEFEYLKARKRCSMERWRQEYGLHNAPKG